MGHRNEGSGLKAKAFRWMLGFILLSGLVVALTFAHLLPLVIAYWIGLLLAVLAIGAMAVYFVAHHEVR